MMERVKSSLVSSKRRDRETSSVKLNDKLLKEVNKINKDTGKTSVKRERSQSPKESRKRIKRSTSGERTRRFESPVKQQTSPKPKSKRNSDSESITLNNKKPQNQFSNKYESITDNDDVDNKKIFDISTLDWPNLLNGNQKHKKNSILQFYSPVSVLARIGLSENYFETETIKYLNKLSTKKSSKQEINKEICLFGESKELEFRKQLFSKSRDSCFQEIDKQNKDLKKCFELIKFYNI